MDFPDDISVWEFTEREKSTYRSAFLSLEPSSDKVTGEQARSVFLQSGLKKVDLKKIWELCDLDKDGKLTLEEFFIGCKLINLRRRGYPLPSLLPFPLRPKSFWSNDIPILTDEDFFQYKNVFNTLDTGKEGRVSGSKMRDFVKDSKVPKEILAEIWNLCDENKKGSLNLSEFIVCQHLVTAAEFGCPIPKSLPKQLSPEHLEKTKLEAGRQYIVFNEEKECFMEAQKELERRRKELQRQEHEINEELKKSQVTEELRLKKLSEQREMEFRRQILLNKQREQEQQIINARKLDALRKLNNSQTQIQRLRSQLEHVIGNRKESERKKETVELRLIRLHKSHQELCTANLDYLRQCEELSLAVKNLKAEYKDLCNEFTRLQNNKKSLSSGTFSYQKGTGNVEKHLEEHSLKVKYYYENIKELESSLSLSEKRLNQKKIIVKEKQRDLELLSQQLERALEKRKDLEDDRSNYSAYRNKHKKSIKKSTLPDSNKNYGSALKELESQVKNRSTRKLQNEKKKALLNPFQDVREEEGLFQGIESISWSNPFDQYASKPSSPTPSSTAIPRDSSDSHADSPSSNRSHETDLLEKQNSGEIYTAIGDYHSKFGTDISFKKGDTVKVIEKKNNDWWFGVVRDKNGWVPANRLSRSSSLAESDGRLSFSQLDTDNYHSEALDTFPAHGTPHESGAGGDNQFSKTLSCEENALTAKAIRNFFPGDTSEIPLRKGDIILVTNTHTPNEELWEGIVYEKGRQSARGLFPKSCLQLLSQSNTKGRDSRCATLYNYHSEDPADLHSEEVL
ncbi:intersectin-1-like isoform X2 [Zophobas morio]|uniref:intersectin-1-like isoform X2 n=1 Tax=Zophobas morio TaxID=2755281 RepID=UPI003083BAF8